VKGLLIFSLSRDALIRTSEILIAPSFRLLQELFGDRVLVFETPENVQDAQTLIGRIVIFTGATFTEEAKMVMEKEGLCERQAEVVRYLNKMGTLGSWSYTGKRLRRFRLVKKIVPTSERPIRFPDEMALKIEEHKSDNWREAERMIGGSLKKMTDLG
jgi:hypothetical protein